MRPPEFLNILDMVGNYYRWFYIDMKDKVKGDDLEKNITIDLKLSSWIDCLERKVKLREMSLPDLLKWCDYVEEEINENGIDLININGQREMIDLFRDINNIIIKHNTDDTMDEDKQKFYTHVNENLIYKNKVKLHLLIPVFSHLRPTMGAQFVNHILLSMGRFGTEIDLRIHPTIRDSLIYAKLVTNTSDAIILENNSSILCNQYINDHVQYFPNSDRSKKAFIVKAGDLFDNVIIHNQLCISEMPPVQMSILNASKVEEIAPNFDMT
jgi:hypothetical protein